MTELNKNYKDSLETLSLRMPELAWKLSNLFTTINPNLLPRGLFNNQLEVTPKSCIDEINRDLDSLNKNKNERSSRYIAEQVVKKINVLVNLCKIKKEKTKTTCSIPFGVESISTRQQRILLLEEQIASLSAQLQALKSTLANKQVSAVEPIMILNLKAEIGEVERLLTLAKDQIAKYI